MTRRTFSRRVAREAREAGLPKALRVEATLYALRLWDAAGPAEREKLERGEPMGPETLERLRRRWEKAQEDGRQA